VLMPGDSVLRGCREHFVLSAGNREGTVTLAGKKPAVRHFACRVRCHIACSFQGWATKEDCWSATFTIARGNTLVKCIIVGIHLTKFSRDYYFIDSGNGTFASVSLFANRSDGEQFNTVAMNWVREHIGSLAPTAPKVESRPLSSVPLSVDEDPGGVLSGAMRDL
jgi:hypothetical protein